jgi:class 3 adenylate cyclase
VVGLSRVLDIGAGPGDERDLRVRKRAAVGSALAFMGFAVAVGIVNTMVANYEEAVLASCQFVVFGSALLVFRRNHRLGPLVVTMSAVGTGILFLSLFPSGGISWGATNLVWVIMVPMSAVLFLGSRSAIPALAAIVAVVVVAVVLDPVMWDVPPEPTMMRLVIEAVNILGPASIALALVVFIDGERVRARAESEALLLNTLPRSIADRLKQGERVIADHYDAVTVLFSDLVDFTPFAAHEPPARVVALLNEIFSEFDSLAERFGLEKIKTIGDGYMVVAGAPETRPDHAPAILDMALEMQAVGFAWSPDERPFRLRIGVATGPAVAGVIGQRKFSYDIWGDAVNMASRMESTAVPGTIQVAASTWELCEDRFSFTPRDVDVKGMGLLRTYQLDSRRVPPEAMVSIDRDQT